MHIFKDKFFKVVGFNSISMIFKILMGVISTKLAAVYLGVHGINTLEFFRNFTSASDTVSQAGIQSGIVKNFALSKTKEQNQKIITTSLTMMWALTVLASLFIFLFRAPIQHYLFQSDSFEKIILIYLLFLPFIAIQTVITGYLQGKQFYKKVVLLNTAGYLLNIGLSFLLIINGGLKGAMLQIVVAPILLTLLSFLYVRKEFKGYTLFSPENFDHRIARSLLGFSVMNLLSSILTPLSFIFLRNLIQNQTDPNSAGIWSSVIRLSAFYMLFVSSLCSLYFFPKLSATSQSESQKQTVSEYFTKFIPLVSLGLFLCFVLQRYIVLLLYTKDFIAITNVFYLQLIADFIRSMALIYGYFLMARQSMKTYIVFELISIGTYCFGAWFLIRPFGLNGVFYGLIISLIIYLILVRWSYTKAIKQ